MKKLLSLLGSVGMIGTAGATVVACNKTKKDEPKQPATPKEQLEGLIKQGWDLVDSSDKDINATIALKNVIEETTAILNKEDAQEAELIAAIDKINNAIEAFNQEEAVAIREQLANAITYAEEIKDDRNKTEGAKTMLQTAIDGAKRVSENEEATDEIVKEAVTSLRAAIKIFRESAYVVDKSELAAKIVEAQKAITESKNPNDEAINTLNAAIETAQLVHDDEKSAQSVVDQATTTLDEAITAFKDATKEIAKEALKAKIDEAQKLVDGSKKTKEVTDALKTAITKAKTAYDKTDAKENDYTTATTELTAAIQTFNDAK